MNLCRSSFAAVRIGYRHRCEKKKTKKIHVRFFASAAFDYIYLHARQHARTHAHIHTHTALTGMLGTLYTKLFDTLVVRVMGVGSGHDCVMREERGREREREREEERERHMCVRVCV